MSAKLLPVDPAQQLRAVVIVEAFELDRQGWPILNSNENLLAIGAALERTRQRVAGAELEATPLRARLDVVRGGVWLVTQGEAWPQGYHSHAELWALLDRIRHRARTAEGAREIVKDHLEGAYPFLRVLSECLQRGTPQEAQRAAATVGCLAIHKDPAIALSLRQEPGLVRALHGLIRKGQRDLSHTSQGHL